MNITQLSEKDFEFLKELGSGSFGIVHLVRKIQEDKHYAIKSVKLSQMSQKEKDGALNQVRLLASINIPYVVGYHGAFFDLTKQSLCIVMQFADGGDLQAKITELKDSTQEGFQQTFIWKVAYEILSGLKILHKNKIIHRDIKSANIFFSNGVAKLGDLNVSKVAEQGMCQTQTGTPYYTSPQIWKGQKYSNKCDIWSTGCLLYEMCTLTHPFKARDFPSLYRKVIVGNYDQVPSNYSYDLIELIRMCLTVDDQMRPSASQLLETTVLSGMDANMEKFDSKGGVNLIDAIKCPRVLRFLNTKLPKPLSKDDIKKTVNFATKKQIQRTQGHGFKIHKQQNLQKIRSQKVLPSPMDETDKNILSKVTSKKLIKLPPLQKQQKQQGTLKSPLSFSNKKLKTNRSIKKIASNKHISIDSSKKISHSSIEKSNGSTIKENSSIVKESPSMIKIGSRVLISASSKKIGSQRQIHFGEKQNKKLVL